MESRKLIKLGNSSFAIALPKEWVLSNRLEKGNIIFIEKNGNGELVVFTSNQETKTPEKKIIIETEEKDMDSILAETTSAYINNYNFVTINGKFSKSRLRDIRDILNNLAGIEIIEQNQDRIVVKDILDIKSISIKELIRRMDNIIRSMFDDLIEGATGNIKKISSTLQLVDKDVNKLYFLLWKLIRKGLSEERVAKFLNTNSVDLSSIQWMAMNLEFIGDEIKRISKTCSNSNLTKEQKKYLEDLFMMIQSNYAAAMTAYYKNDKNLALEIASKNDRVTIEKCKKFSEKYSNHNIAQITEKLKSIQSSIHYITRGVSY